MAGHTARRPVCAGSAAALLARIGLGRLPGDLEAQHRGRKFYFPFATSVIFSLVIMLVLWLT
jgi:hypothetical protein